MSEQKFDPRKEDCSIPLENKFSREQLVTFYKMYDLIVSNWDLYLTDPAAKDMDNGEIWRNLIVMTRLMAEEEKGQMQKDFKTFTKVYGYIMWCTLTGKGHTSYIERSKQKTKIEDELD